MENAALAAPFAVFLNNDDRTYVEPDISVICDRSKLNNRGCVVLQTGLLRLSDLRAAAPMDYYKKTDKYQAAGVREYWIVDPLKNRVLSYINLKQMILRYIHSPMKSPVGIYDGDLKLRIENE